MDVAFLMGMIFGFILAFLFFKWFTNSVVKEVHNVFYGPKKKKKDKELNEDGEPGDWWKPKGWKPGD